MKSNNNKIIGKAGEIIAENFLLQKGFEILYKNYRTRYGEIDLIGKKNCCFYFFEVKSRVNDDSVKPFESVNKKKIDRILKTAFYFLHRNEDLIDDDNDINIKIISITFGNSLSKVMSLIKDAYVLDYNKLEQGSDYNIDIIDIYE